MSQNKSNRKKIRISVPAQSSGRRLSPCMPRIKSCRKTDIKADEMTSKLTMYTPKPPSLSPGRSPIKPHRKISFSKISTPQKPKSRISSLTTNQSKNTISPANFSHPELPLPQDLNFFISHLFDFLQTPESLTDYFFLNRKSPLGFADFIESCESLGIHRFFSELERIFQEGETKKCWKKQKFLRKVIEVANSQVKVVQQVKIPRSIERISLRTRKIVEITQGAKGEDFLGKINVGLPEVQVSPKDALHMTRSNLQKSKKKKADLNLTVKLASSPFTVIPSSVPSKKKL